MSLFYSSQRACHCVCGSVVRVNETSVALMSRKSSYANTNDWYFASEMKLILPHFNTVDGFSYKISEF